MRFRFDPPSRAFSNRCVFDENVQRISVDGNPKRIEMHAFSKRKRSFLDSFLFISLYKRCFFFQLVLVTNELTLDKLLTAKSKSSSSLSPASSPRGWVCVYFLLFLFLKKIKPSFCALYVGNPQSCDKHYFNLRWGRLKLINYRTGTKPKLKLYLNFPPPPPPPSLHSKLGCLLFSIGNPNSGTTLRGGMGEEKLYFPLWKAVKFRAKCLN